MMIESSSFPATMALKLSGDMSKTTLLKAAREHSQNKNNKSPLASKKKNRGTSITDDDLLAFPTLEWGNNNNDLPVEKLLRPELGDGVSQCLQDALALGRDFDDYRSNIVNSGRSLPSHPEQQRPSKRQRMKYGCCMVRSARIPSCLYSLDADAAASEEQQEDMLFNPKQLLGVVPPKIVFPTLLQRRKVSLVSIPSSLISEHHHGPSRSLPSLKCTVSPLA